MKEVIAYRRIACARQCNPSAEVLLQEQMILEDGVNVEFSTLL